MPTAFDVYEFYLRAEDLHGRTIAATVAGVVVKELWDPRIKRNVPHLVLSFVGKKKRLPLNKTQAAAMIATAGTDDYSKWIGVAVLLTPTVANNKQNTIAITPAPASAGDGEVSEPPESAPSEQSA